jgi:hypothetical protein
MNEMEGLFNDFIGDEALAGEDRQGGGIEAPLREVLLPCTPLDLMPQLFGGKKKPASGGTQTSKLPDYISPAYRGETRQQNRGGVRHRGTGGRKWKIGLDQQNDDGDDHTIEYRIDDPDWI